VKYIGVNEIGTAVREYSKLNPNKKEENKLL